MRQQSYFTVADHQSDISLMISPRHFRRFVQPYIRQQAVCPLHAPPPPVQPAEIHWQ